MKTNKYTLKLGGIYSEVTLPVCPNVGDVIILNAAYGYTSKKEEELADETIDFVECADQITFVVESRLIYQNSQSVVYEISPLNEE